MAKIAGKVNKVLTKDYNGTTLYSIEVGGKMFGTGSFAPNAVEGDYVEFESDTSVKYPKVAPRSLKKTEAPATGIAAPPTGTSGGYNRNNKDTQDVISKQAARNSAIAFFTELRLLEALPTPPKTAKSGDKIGLYTAMLDEMTTAFYNYAMGNAAAAATPAADKPTPPAEEDNWDQ